ncbi:HAD hydrolase-like protein [Microbacterium sp. KUDC0406]|uniref:HAD hydrolase-like protein n=1 Tax=Microbacterium sp. KUDC0406 TaxID=2909588 RepID=UPI001F2711B2|nr:HAD hydrolase-like protein [Microbacterium sp. KUDC0406]UJP09590.1 HAD hydrolase-like protein [Microbacterium sp. KUDC0406]
MAELSSTPAPTAVLLDLDGTITDSAAAITTAAAATLRRAGYPALLASALLRFAGPPIREGFSTIVGAPGDHLDDLVREFRRQYRPRMHDVTVYDGMRDLLADLNSAGIPLALATSKVRTLAVQILQRLGLDQHFVVICGARDDETGGTKAEVVRDALRALADAGCDLTAPVLVGDRRHDIEGAQANDIAAILVRWGFGDDDEGAGAMAVVQDVPELATHLLPARIPGAGIRR